MHLKTRQRLRQLDRVQLEALTIELLWTVLDETSGDRPDDASLLALLEQELAILEGVKE